MLMEDGVFSDSAVDVIHIVDQYIQAFLVDNVRDPIWTWGFGRFELENCLQNVFAG